MRFFDLGLHAQFSQALQRQRPTRLVLERFLVISDRIVTFLQSRGGTPSPIPGFGQGGNAGVGDGLQGDVEAVLIPPGIVVRRIGSHLVPGDAPGAFARGEFRVDCKSLVKRLSGLDVVAHLHQHAAARVPGEKQLPPAYLLDACGHLVERVLEVDCRVCVSA